MSRVDAALFKGDSDTGSVLRKTGNEGVQDILEFAPADKPGRTGLILRFERRSGENRKSHKAIPGLLLTSTTGAISGLRASNLAPAFPERKSLQWLSARGKPGRGSL